MLRLNLIPVFLLQCPATYPYQLILTIFLARGIFNVNDILVRHPIKVMRTCLNWLTFTQQPVEVRLKEADFISWQDIYFFCGQWNHLGLNENLLQHTQCYTKWFRQQCLTAILFILHSSSTSCFSTGKSGQSKFIGRSYHPFINGGTALNINRSLTYDTCMAACIESHVTGDINKFLDNWVSG